MYMNVVYLSISQLMSLGVHLGHDKKNIKFLSSWIFGGWSYNIFVMNLIKTVFLFKLGLRIFVSAGLRSSPVWYVTLNRFFGPLVASYGYIMGEIFNIYWWMNGSITNFFAIVGWHQLLIRLMMKNKYSLSHIDKKKLLGFFGMMHHSKSMPFVGFIPNVLDSISPVDEFMTGNMACVGIMDSNVSSWNVSVPVPGNDDSLMCINYYSYMMSSSVLSGKMTFISSWKYGIYNVKVKYRSFYKFVYLYLNCYNNLNKSDFFNMLQHIDFNKLFFDLNVSETILENSFLTNIYSKPKKNLFFLIDKTKEDFDLFYV